MDGFLTLMVPYLKSGVRSEYAVNAFIRQKPFIICDLEIAVTPLDKEVTGEMVDSDSNKVIIHTINWFVCLQIVELSKRGWHYLYKLM